MFTVMSEKLSTFGRSLTMLTVMLERQYSPLGYITVKSSKLYIFPQKFEDIKCKTAKDMARVLDCSSFKIQLSSSSGGLHESEGKI